MAVGDGKARVPVLRSSQRMGRLSAGDLGRLREIEALLNRVDLNEPSRGLTDGVGALREVTGARAALLYDLEPWGDGLRVGQAHHHGIARQFTSVMNDFLVDKTVGWSGYNPLAPEPHQRNVVLAWDPPAGSARSAVEQHVYPKSGVGGWGTTRVVVCDRSEMLAYLALFDPAPSDRRAREILGRTVSAVARRMRFERDLRAGSDFRVTIDVALEQIGATACLVDDRGRLLAANALARQAYARDARAFRERVVSCVRGKRRQHGFRVVPVVVRGTRRTFLLIEKTNAEPRNAQVARAASRFGLSAGQARVASLVAEGHSNRAIALTLGIAERTVESHLTAIFEKTAVGSRAALVALFWSIA